jgi:hypothetical protein
MNSSSIINFFHSPSMYMFFIFIMILLLVVFVFDDTSYVINKKPQVIDIRIDSKPYRNNELTTVKYVNRDENYYNDMYLYNQTAIDDLEPSFL